MNQTTKYPHKHNILATFLVLALLAGAGSFVYVVGNNFDMIDITAITYGITQHQAAIDVVAVFILKIVIFLSYVLALYAIAKTNSKLLYIAAWVSLCATVVAGVIDLSYLSIGSVHPSVSALENSRQTDLPQNVILVYFMVRAAGWMKMFHKNPEKFVQMTELKKELR